MDNCLSPIEYVKQSLGARDVLEALAEECCELAQAALKTIRAAEGSNPTPISYDACIDKLTEETNDVLMVLTLLGKVPAYVTERNPKWDGWANRIANRTVTAKTKQEVIPDWREINDTMFQLNSPGKNTIPKINR